MEGIKRIKELAQSVKENLNIQMIVEYLINREDMDEKYLNEDKNLKDMWNYIVEEAKKNQKNGVTVMKDEEVFSLAIHYFDETNESLGIKSENNIKEGKQENIEQKKLDSKIEENIQKVEKEHIENNDDDTAMIFRGKKVTYKELREGTYLNDSTSKISL